MELKGCAVARGLPVASPRDPNPFNGIESLVGLAAICLCYVVMNPFNGIESVVIPFKRYNPE